MFRVSALPDMFSGSSQLTSIGEGCQSQIIPSRARIKDRIIPNIIIIIDSITSRGFGEWIGAALRDVIITIGVTTTTYSTYTIRVQFLT